MNGKGKDIGMSANNEGKADVKIKKHLSPERIKLMKQNDIEKPKVTEEERRY